MKITQLFLSTMMVLAIFCTSLDSQNVSWNKNLTAGEKLEISFKPEEQVKEAKAVVYFLTDVFEPIAKSVSLKASDSGMNGSIEIPEKASAMGLVILDGKGEALDNNEEKSYIAAIKDKMGNAQTDSKFNKAALMTNWASQLKAEPDFEKGIKVMEMALKQEGVPDLSKKYVQLQNMIMRGKVESGKSTLSAYADELMSRRKLTDSEYSFIHGYYKLMLKDKEQAAKIEKKALKRFPEGEIAFSNARTALFQTQRKGIDQLKEANDNYVALAKARNEENALDISYRIMAMALAKDGQLDEALKHVRKIENTMSRLGTLNSMAWPRTGQDLDAEAPEIDWAVKFSKEAVEGLEAITIKDKPNFYTEDQWESNLNYSKGMYIDTYALALYKSGKKEEGTKYQAIACEANEYSDPDMNERLVAMFKETRPAAETEKLAADLIIKNQSTAKLEELYRSVFVANNTIDQAFDKQLAMLKKEAEKEYRKELEEKMINEEAPAFDLVDINGNKVNLADLKGKIKVLDFWATWCGPCKASFPGMQKAQEEFANRDDVVFLFVNSWESGDTFDEKKKAASDFMTEKEYPFTVLMDAKDKVITSYKVDGIPTKFIIDKDNKIRFKSVGYSGSSDKLVKELKMMIEMADRDSSTTASLRD
ncbi:MAG: TlpA disulfide reductase family protein [Bacteroidota bacterium]